MKIYTEVNYEWTNGKLVKVSDESFNHEGVVSECKGGGSSPAPAPVTNNYYYEGEIGPAGPIGPQGVPGPAGYQGLAGAQGQAGAQGDTGAPALNTASTTPQISPFANLQPRVMDSPLIRVGGAQGIAGLHYTNPASLVTQGRVNTARAPYMSGQFAPNRQMG
jgi:hypothetical protein